MGGIDKPPTQKDSKYFMQIYITTKLEHKPLPFRYRFPIVNLFQNVQHGKINKSNFTVKKPKEPCLSQAVKANISGCKSH